MTPAAADANTAAGVGEGRKDVARGPGCRHRGQGRGASELLCGLRGGTCRRQGLPVIGSRPAGRWSPKWATPGQLYGSVF